MRCKPGDIAVIVGGETENLGVFVKVLVPHETHEAGWVWTFEDASRPVAMWEVDAPADAGPAIRIRATAEDPSGEAWLVDEGLRPIRDQPGTDETLQWAPMPKADATMRPKPQKEFM